MRKAVYSGRKVNGLHAAYQSILYRLNKRIAQRNQLAFPQIAIYSFDYIGLAVNLDGRYEAADLDILGQFLTNYLCVDTDSTALDVGANIGNHSIFFSQIFKDVVAFEPNPYVFNLLKINSDGLNISPMNYGLSNENSTLTLSFDRNNLGAGRIKSAVVVAGSASPEVAIRVCRLDDVTILDDRNVSLIKLDVEGHELSVLEGAAGLIARTRPVIVFEQNKDVIQEGRSEVTEFLRNRSYEFYTIQTNFDFGKSRLARMAARGLRTILGFRREIVPTSYFNNISYAMVIAVPGPESSAQPAAHFPRELR